MEGLFNPIQMAGFATGRPTRRVHLMPSGWRKSCKSAQDNFRKHDIVPRLQELSECNLWQANQRMLGRYRRPEKIIYVWGRMQRSRQSMLPVEDLVQSTNREHQDPLLGFACPIGGAALRSLTPRDWKATFTFNTGGR